MACPVTVFLVALYLIRWLAFDFRLTCSLYLVMLYASYSHSFLVHPHVDLHALEYFMVNINFSCTGDQIIEEHNVQLGRCLLEYLF